LPPRLSTRRSITSRCASSRCPGRGARDLEAIGAEHLTIDEAFRFATQPPGAARVWSAGKLGIIRGFARYLFALDPATEVPPTNLLPEPSHRIVPYIYSDKELAKVLAAADHLKPEHRADTYRHVISLLAVTGMRVGEAVRLDRDDVDLDRGLLTIVNSKFGQVTSDPAAPDNGRGARVLSPPTGRTTTEAKGGELLHLEHWHTPAARQREHGLSPPRA
jgi:integrase